MAVLLNGGSIKMRTFFIDIHLAKHDIRPFHGHLSEDWVHHLARPTPRSPEVQDNGFGRFFDEVVVRPCRNNYPRI